MIEVYTCNSVSIVTRHLDLWYVHVTDSYVCFVLLNVTHHWAIDVCIIIWTLVCFLFFLHKKTIIAVKLYLCCSYIKYNIKFTEQTSWH